MRMNMCSSLSFSYSNVHMYVCMHVCIQVSFFSTPEKTQRIEEFTMNQQASNNAVTAAVKDTWLNAITGCCPNEMYFLHVRMYV